MTSTRGIRSQPQQPQKPQPQQQQQQPQNGPLIRSKSRALASPKTLITEANNNTLEAPQSKTRRATISSASVPPLPRSAKSGDIKLQDTNQQTSDAGGGRNSGRSEATNQTNRTLFQSEDQVDEDQVPRPERRQTVVGFGSSEIVAHRPQPQNPQRFSDSSYEELRSAYAERLHEKIARLNQYSALSELPPSQSPKLHLPTNVGNSAFSLNGQFADSPTTTHSDPKSYYTYRESSQANLQPLHNTPIRSRSLQSAEEMLAENFEPRVKGIRGMRGRKREIEESLTKWTSMMTQELHGLSKSLQDSSRGADTPDPREQFAATDTRLLNALRL